MWKLFFDWGGKKDATLPLVQWLGREDSACALKNARYELRSVNSPRNPRLVWEDPSGEKDEYSIEFFERAG